MPKDMKFETKTIHAGVEPDESTGAVMTPIYQTSTYAQKSPGVHKGFAYSRSGNPTRAALEKNLAALENAKYGLCFGSGMAAIDCVLRLLVPGDEVITTHDLYGGSYRIFEKVYREYGIKFHFMDLNDLDSVEAIINENTKLLWVETPTNPLLNIVDLKKISNLARKCKLLLAVDNTFSSPYLQNPMDLGADIVMHSVTKYINGHSDVVMGALVCNDESLFTKLRFVQNSCGAVPGPQDCFLVLRGIKTLHLRMERHCENGRGVARFLKSHPKVNKVYWPGFEDHPNHDVAASQMKDFGGMLSFSLKQDRVEDALKFLSHVKIFTLAESLGGVESLVGHPVTMTHGAIPKEEREKAGITDSLIRMSVGIEHLDDLLSDLEQAFNKI